MDLIGLRDEDLTDAERTERDALLADPAHAEAQRFAEGLADALVPLAEAEGGPETLRRPARRGWGLGAGLALAAAALLAVGLSVGSDDGRWKGGASLGAVELQAFAEGPGGLRPLSDGAMVGARERVVFKVRTDRPGQVGVDELVDGVRAPVLPASERGAGEHVPGGAQPLSWRPDREAPEAVYEAQWCDVERPDACVTDGVRLRWE